MRRRLGRLPEAVMGGKRAIGGAEALQPPIEQREMHRLVGAYAEPVVDELRRKVRAETARHVEGEVDGSELDVGQGVKHRDPTPLRAALPALRHPGGRQQPRPWRTEI